MVYSTGTTSTSCSTDSAWTSWTATSGTTASTDKTWIQWSSTGTSTSSINFTSATDMTQIWYTWNTQTFKQQYLQQPVISEEDIRIANERERERELQIKKEQEILNAKFKEREEKARQLLREVLDDEQNKQFDEKGFFELTAVKSGNIYRINKGRSRNVELLDKERKTIQRLCFHPQEHVHNYDTMVAQKLMLEMYEDDVRKVANYTSY